MDSAEVQVVEETLATMTARADGEALTNQLDEFGWLELLRTEARVAVPALFTAQGRSSSWSAGLHDVLANQLVECAALDARAATVVLPRPHRRYVGSQHGGGVSIDGLCVGARATPSSLIVIADRDAMSPVLLRIERDAITVETSKGLDPRLHVEHFCGGVAASGEILAEGADASNLWGVTEAAGRRALSHQISGALEAMLALALAHARERVQFGRRIATFQAVRHKLAEAHVAVTAAEAAATAAWDTDDVTAAAAAAKLVASRACALTVAHTQQVLAGVGFTADHPYHHLMKRVVVLDRLLGSAGELAREIGRHLVALGRAPRLVEL
jgi:hypothetical protein